MDGDAHTNEFHNLINLLAVPYCGASDVITDFRLVGRTELQRRDVALGEGKGSVSGAACLGLHAAFAGLAVPGGDVACDVTHVGVCGG